MKSEHTPEQISRAMTQWIDKNYHTLAETFLQKGYEKKMYFPQYVAQMFFQNYMNWLEEKQKQENIGVITEDF